MIISCPRPPPSTLLFLFISYCLHLPLYPHSPLLVSIRFPSTLLPLLLGRHKQIRQIFGAPLASVASQHPSVISFQEERPSGGLEEPARRPSGEGVAALGCLFAFGRLTHLFVFVTMCVLVKVNSRPVCFFCMGFIWVIS